MPNYDNIWKAVLSESANLPADVIATITEDGINYFLTKHYKFDNDKYTVTFNKTFVVSDDAGKPVERTFTLSLIVNNPVQIQLPPFAMIGDPRLKPIAALYSDTMGWNRTFLPDQGTSLAIPKSGSTDPNVRVFATNVGIKLTWPRLDGTKPDWEWDPKPISIVGEGYIELIGDQNTFALRVTPTRIKFAEASAVVAHSAWQALLGQVSPGERKALQDDEQKFNDLLVIALNIVGERLGPNLVQNISIPAFSMAGAPLMPSFLALESNSITAGFSIDHPSLAAQNAASVAAVVERLKVLVAEDVEVAGGIEKLIVKGYKRQIPIFRTRAEIGRQLIRSNAYVKELRARNQKKAKAKRSRTNPEEPDCIAVGVNQYLLQTLATRALPAPQSGEISAGDLGIIKGSIVWWLNVPNASITIQGKTVSGSVDVDIGGSIKACIRKFWDCSWHWTCDQVGLALTGDAAVSVRLDQGDGVRFYLHIDSLPSLTSVGIPSPFSDVVDAIGSLVSQAIAVVANAAIGSVAFDIILPKIKLPEQKTELEFHGTAAASFTRVDSDFSAPKNVYIREETGITATSG